MLLSVLLGGMLFAGLKSKFEDLSSRKNSNAGGTKCPCPTCRTELYDTLKAKQAGGRGSSGLDRRGITCSCGTWSEWETMGDPPVLFEASTKKAVAR